jgi:hypothetical protein
VPRSRNTAQSPVADLGMGIDIGRGDIGQGGTGTGQAGIEGMGTGLERTYQAPRRGGSISNSRVVFP